MASKLTKTCLLTSARGLATKTASSQQGAAAGALQIEKSRTGATLVSVDSNEPLSRVGVFLKAGSRFTSVPGLSHVLQHCGSGGLSAPQRTGLSMVRTTEQLGGTKGFTVGREVAMYSVASFRDCVDETLSVLSSITSNCEYPLHEFPNETEMTRLKASLKISPVERVRDMAVKAAYRNQPLGNSIYTPDYNVDNISAAMVNDFVRSTHGSQGLVIVGTGLDSDLLFESSSAMGVADGGVASVSTPTKYFGGDVRVEVGSGKTAVIVAGEGAKYASTDSLALMIAAELLGSVKSLSYSEGVVGILNRVLKGTSAVGVGFNDSWSDAGLFGFSLETTPADANKAVQAAVSAVKNLSASEKDVAAAKAAVISRIAAAEYGCGLVESIGTQMLLTGSYYSASDAAKAIDAVTPAAVNKAVAKAFGGKLTVASYGSVDDVPYADTL